MHSSPNPLYSVLTVVESTSSIRVFQKKGTRLSELTAASHDRIEHPIQGAFAFPPSDQYNDCCLSPNECILATRDGDSITLGTAEAYEEAPANTINAALAMLFATSCQQNIASDDLLHCIYNSKDPSDPVVLREQIFNASDTDLDWVPDEQQSQPRLIPFLSSPTVTRLFSLLEALFGQSEGNKIGSKTASVVLELRAFALIVQGALSSSAEQASTVGMYKQGPNLDTIHKT